MYYLFCEISSMGERIHCGEIVRGWPHTVYMNRRLLAWARLGLAKVYASEKRAKAAQKEERERFRICEAEYHRGGEWATAYEINFSNN